MFALLGYVWPGSWLIRERGKVRAFKREGWCVAGLGLFLTRPICQSVSSKVLLLHPSGGITIKEIIA